MTHHTVRLYRDQTLGPVQLKKTTFFPAMSKDDASSTNDENITYFSAHSRYLFGSNP